MKIYLYRDRVVVIVLMTFGLWANATTSAQLVKKYAGFRGLYHFKYFDTPMAAAEYAGNYYCEGGLYPFPNVVTECKTTLMEGGGQRGAPTWAEGYDYMTYYKVTNTQTGEVFYGGTQGGLHAQFFCPQGYSRHRYSHCWTDIAEEVVGRSNRPRNACNFGNPINVATRTKLQVENDLVSYGGFGFVLRRYYNHRLSEAKASFGKGWRHDLDFYLPGRGARNNILDYPAKYTQYHSVADDPGLPIAQVSMSLELITISNPDGTHVVLRKSGNDYIPLLDNDAKLRGIEENSASGGWIYRDPVDGVIYLVNNQGLPTSKTTIDGKKISLAYSTNSTSSQIAPAPFLLTKAMDPYGRMLNFVYDAESNIKSIALGDAPPITYSYNQNQSLVNVQYPGGAYKSYFYGEASLLDGFSNDYYLTGIQDENQKRFSYFSYDMLGVKATEHAGGVSKFSIKKWIQEPQENTALVELEDPIGALNRYQFSLIHGRWSLNKRSQPAGSGCAASTSSIAYDNRGNTESEDDFNGKRVCRAYERNRNFETARVEGLNGGDSGTSCATALSATNLTALAPEARKITTEWHPDWKLETRRAEPGQITTWIYNGQPDPFNGGIIAACTSPMYGATGVDPLPDGKPIVVLCKQVVQATTDATGSQGFAAMLEPSGSGSTLAITSRTLSYTYNQYGQVLTSTDERGLMTTYAYYTETTANYTKGDLWKITNALGHVVEYTRYNPYGQVLQVLDSNGVATSYTYDLRQRMTSLTQAGQLTQIEWWPTGLLKKVTQPDGSWLHYLYDDAHRLTDIADNLGNSVHYLLDNAGNRTQEQVKDFNGLLTRQINRNYDNLNRLWKASTGVSF